MDKEHLGLAIIIKPQKQVDDVTKLEVLFKKIGIQVQSLHWNLDNLGNISEDLSARDLSRYNSLFLCFIAGHRRDNHNVILCPRNLSFDLETLIVGVGRNPTLEGRPKLILLDFKCKLQSRIGFPDIFIGFGQGPSFFDTFCRRIEETFDKTSFVTIFDDVCNDSEDDFEFQSTLRKKLYLLRKGELVLLELLI